METKPDHNPPAKRVNGRVWQPGESGNPHGRPIGARGRFSQRFIADLTDSWEQHGAEALARTAREYPDRYVAIACHLIPKDVALTISTPLPGNLDREDWAIMLDLVQAIKQALPNARDRAPGEVLEYVKSRLA